jgi:glutamate racemase
MNKIGVFDSGIGGITTLKEIIKILPKEEYIYYADSKNNPYGTKDYNELFNIVDNIVKYFIKRNVKLIVIACNTATTKCINKLRAKYPDILFVGTEPAIKVACDKNYKNTLVLATPGTISSKRVKKLLRDNKKENQNITLVACDNLANAIETYNNKLIDKLLHEYLSIYKKQNIDAIVLGCTHYPIIKDKLQKLFPKATIIDGNKGVAKRVKFLLEENNIKNNNYKIEFIQTKKHK